MVMIFIFDCVTRQKSVRTNCPETKSNKKGLEPRQNNIDEKGQSVIRNIALKNWATMVNASLRHDIFALEFKDVLAREVAKECKDYTKLRWLTRVFLRLDSARYHRQPNVSINRAFTNDASNPKKKGNHFGA